MSMRQRRRRRAHKAEFARRTLPGAPPGVLVPEAHAARPNITVISYGLDGHVEMPLADVAALRPLLDQWPVTWVNVDGLGDASAVAEIGRFFGFHPLALEDVLHVHQRAKVEQYGETLFIVARMPTPDVSRGMEQISIFLGKRFVVTFQEHSGGDCLNPVRVRIRTGVSKLRCAGPDCLAYALLDAIIDHYFPLLEHNGERLNDLEEEILREPSRRVVGRLHGVRRDLLTIRRAVWPLRDALNSLLRDPNPLISAETRVYLRDCYDHTVQIIDLLESYRELGAGLTEMYLSQVSLTTNEIMKVLTIFSSIFIPLTFLVGVYGMNFDFLPELHWRWGYAALWLLMLSLTAGLLIFFRKRGWIGRQAEAEDDLQDEAEATERVS